jgi:uncharacterized protein (DUF3084 family)
VIQISVVLLAALLILGASRLLGFWAFLVLLGGTLSHLGDHLGTYVGKKRLSLFGIRPRHTAVLVNFSTGALITLATLVGAVLISADYREALLGVQEKKAERELLTRENASLVASQRELSARLAATEPRLKKVEEDLRRADAAREVLNREIEKLEKAKREEEEKVRAKESERVALPLGSPLLPRPLLVAADVERGELREKLISMLEEIRASVKSVGLKVRVPGEDRVERDLVGAVHDKIRQIRAFLKKRTGQEADGPVPSQLYIRPLARKNHVPGDEFSSIQFEILPNWVIYRKGDEIAHTALDGRLPEEKLLQQLFNFDTRIQEEMQKRGVLQEALMNRLGRVSASLLWSFTKIVGRVKELRGWATLRLVTTDDILAFGEINATYVVRERERSERPSAPRGPGLSGSRPDAAPSAAAPVPAPPGPPGP